MFTYRTLGTASGYGRASGYPAAPLSYPASTALRLPENVYEVPFSMEADAQTLGELLAAPDEPAGSGAPGYGGSLVEQVFGGQLRQQRLALQHLAHLLGDRARLHQRLVRDIGHRHMHLQGELFRQLQLHGKPVLVFDWKRNYRDMLVLPEFADVAVYTAGRGIAPFRFNPPASAVHRGLGLVP